MSRNFGVERRDPVSGVLMLGTILSRVSKRRETGYVAVRDHGREHSIKIVDGAIELIASDRVTDFLTEPNRIRSRVQELFALPRPLSVFAPCHIQGKCIGPVDPMAMIVKGIIKRADLFDPVVLMERIPHNALTLKLENKKYLQLLSLSDEEKKFVSCLDVPTPLAMLFWKRGLNPRHAGALVVALNLIGMFENWEPGFLPRPGTATHIQRKSEGECSDHELLGVSHDASLEEIDRAFRMLALELHPDRLIGLSAREASRAESAYLVVSAAHARLRQSRRRRPVRDPVGGYAVHSRASWLPFVKLARKASQQGDHKRARAFAVKAIALLPPEEIKQELLLLVKRVA